MVLTFFKWLLGFFVVVGVILALVFADWTKWSTMGAETIDTLRTKVNSYLTSDTDTRLWRHTIMDTTFWASPTATAGSVWIRGYVDIRRSEINYVLDLPTPVDQYAVQLVVKPRNYPTSPIVKITTFTQATGRFGEAAACQQAFEAVLRGDALFLVLVLANGGSSDGLTTAALSP